MRICYVLGTIGADGITKSDRKKEHYQLFRCLSKARLQKAAVRLLKRHIDTAGEQLIAYLQQIAQKR
ncbi:hypothetical protein FM036_35360 [Nostoc sp. HG1]|nr:hypothetical protein [Nostoc sp. HG1]